MKYCLNCAQPLTFTSEKKKNYTRHKACDRDLKNGGYKEGQWCSCKRETRRQCRFCNIFAKACSICEEEGINGCCLFCGMWGYRITS